MAVLREKLKSCRRQKKLTHQRLAVESGVAYAVIWNMETMEDYNPTLRVLIKIAKRLGVDVRDLIDSSDPYSDIKFRSDLP